MAATLHTILNRMRDMPAKRAVLSNFELGEASNVPSTIVINEHGWSLYCLNQETKQAVFVQTPQHCDLSSKPFLRMAQFEGASQVLLVPWGDLEALASETALPKNLVLIFNIGRSGTTLVSRMLDNAPNILSLSEPNAQLDITMNRAANGEALTNMLVASCTRLLCNAPYGPTPETVAFKFYSQCIFNCDEYYANFPNAKYVFLYRDGKSWANSRYKMARSYGRPEIYNTADKDFVWMTSSAASDPQYMETFFNQTMEPFYPAQVFAAAWALQLEEYMKHFQAGVPFLALRYNELVSDKAGSTTALLQHCGLPTDALPEILKSFEQDSQEGSGIGQDNKVEGFKPKDYQCFVDTLANHPRFHSPDVILPDIYHRQ